MGQLNTLAARDRAQTDLADAQAKVWKSLDVVLTVAILMLWASAPALVIAVWRWAL
jgi:hypothetical protein